MKRREFRVIFAGFCEDGTIFTQKQMQQMFSLPGEEIPRKGFDCSDIPNEKLENIYRTEQSRVMDEISATCGAYFDTELEKLEKWAHDVKKSMELNIKSMDSEIAELRTQARKLKKLQDKLDIQSRITELEAKRNKQRLDLYGEQDKIDRQKEKLIAETQAKLGQRVEEKLIFAIKWRIV